MRVHDSQAYRKMDVTRERISRSVSPRGQWRTGKNGENWLQNEGIDDDDDVCVCCVCM